MNKKILFSITFAALNLTVFISPSWADKQKEEDNNENKEPTEKMTVYGRKLGRLGEDISASEGIVSQGEILQRPTLRTGEILEFVPGMVVTQHSGAGKANQYFLRGFNLDHGTDFKTTIDGMPVNMRSHGHGQGYTDLSFIVPEFIQSIEYQKGPYHAEDGDFSTAGSAHFSAIEKFDSPMLQIEAGENQYLRSVFGSNLELDNSDNVAIGLETQRYDGPWVDIKEDTRKFNTFLSYVSQSAESSYSLTFMGYDNQWNSADQIPSRTVASNLINRLGSLDLELGGKSSRYSISGKWANKDWAINAYAITSSLDLFSNFTYFLDDPINGDQFEQVDKRNIYGGQSIRKSVARLKSTHLHNTFGVQFRYDDIKDVALYKTQSRQRLSTTRADKLDEYSVSLFWESEMYLTDYLSGNLGVRYDYIGADVQSNILINSGKANDGLFSLKGGAKYEFTQSWIGYMNVGQSFHSNDARGATISVDPNSGDNADPVDLLVRGEGIEFGTHYINQKHFSTSFSLWLLELDSELLFVGDAGNTEPGRASRRKGIELTAYYWLNNQFSADLELAWSHARFTETAIDEGDRIEGSLPFVGSFGVAWSPNTHWRTSIRLRHFGERTLDSFSNQQSEKLSVTNISVAYSHDSWQVVLKLLNIFDSTDHDIDYYYSSRLQGEPLEGIEDNHFHPIEPRTARVQLRYAF